MAVTVQAMRDEFPTTFGDDTVFSDAYLANKIGQANRRIDADMFDTLADDACLYLAAHLALVDPKGRSDAVKSAKAKDVQITFDWTAEARTFLSVFRDLQRHVTAAGMVGTVC